MAGGREKEQTKRSFSSTAGGGPTHRFVGPVVLFEDVLRAILAAVCKHHYHLVAVGPGGAALLGEDGGETGTEGDELGNVGTQISISFHRFRFASEAGKVRWRPPIVTP